MRHRPPTSFHLSFGSMLSSFNAVETAPPLYFVVGWVWVHLFGNGAVALRSLSALAGTALIPIVYLAGRELRVEPRRAPGRRVRSDQSLHGLVLAGGPRIHARGRFLRRLAALVRAGPPRSPSRRNVAWWGVFSALALLTHYFAAFLVAPEALWLLYTARNRAITTAVAALVVIEPRSSRYWSGTLRTRCSASSPRPR